MEPPGCCQGCPRPIAPSRDSSCEVSWTSAVQLQVLDGQPSFQSGITKHRKPSPETCSAHPLFMPESSGNSQANVFGTQAIDQAVCGIGAGCVSVLCMHPLDLLKVKLQVSSNIPSSTRPGTPLSLANSTIVSSFKEIIRNDGLQGLYRGLTPNLVGNAASWGLYFLWYSIFKDHLATDSEGKKHKLPASRHLLASASSGFVTAMITNPLWVVKTRMFTTRPNSSGAYKNLWDGLHRIAKEEGIRGLWKGTVLALIGVSNGAIQFMTYEELKRWRQDTIQRKTRPQESSNSQTDSLPLSNLEYIVLSGTSKLLAIGLTYPYQVVRSRLQNQLFIPPALSGVEKCSPAVSSPNIVHYRSIPHCISHTFRSEGFKGFYRGLGTNAIRVLPGTCVTFVVYENLSSWLKGLADQRS